MYAEIGAVDRIRERGKRRHDHRYDQQGDYDQENITRTAKERIYLRSAQKICSSNCLKHLCDRQNHKKYRRRAQNEITYKRCEIYERPQLYSLKEKNAEGYGRRREKNTHVTVTYT